MDSYQILCLAISWWDSFEILKAPTVYSQKEVLFEVRCLKLTEDMILALAGQFKQLSHEPEKFR